MSVEPSRAKGTELRVVAAAHLIRGSKLSADPRAVDTIVSAPPPARHCNLYAIGPHPDDLNDSGFLLSDGTFANRIKAAEVARRSGQLTKPLIAAPNLYSEDLW